MGFHKVERIDLIHFLEVNILRKGPVGRLGVGLRILGLASVDNVDIQIKY